MKSPKSQKPTSQKPATEKAVTQKPKPPVVKSPGAKTPVAKVMVKKPAAKSAEKPEAQPSEGLKGFVVRTGSRMVQGAVWNTTEPSCKYVVECFIDGFSVDVALADLFVSSLKKAGDGCHGFFFEIAQPVLEEGHVLEIRLANLGTLVGQPLSLHDEKPAPDGGALPEIQWMGGLRFMGALQPSDHLQKVRAIINGEVVAEAEADFWQNNGLLGESARALPAFSLHMPQRFADGAVHRVHIVDESGHDLPASPLGFVAYPDGLNKLLAAQGTIESDRFRGDMFDKIMPGSFPLSHFKEWQETARHESSAKVCEDQIGVVLIGDGDLDASLATLDAQTHAHWTGLSLPFVDDAQGLDCGELRAFLMKDGAACSAIIFARAGTLFEPDAIARFALAFAENSIATGVYGDVALRDQKGLSWPLAFSAFDYERLLEQGYCCSLFAVRPYFLQGTLQRKTISTFGLFQMIVDDPKTQRILHLPGPLATVEAVNSIAAGRALLQATSEHLRKRRVAAKASLANGVLFPAVRVVREVKSQSVSILIPTRDRVDLLKKCLETIEPAVQKTGAEIIIIDNDSTDPETLAFFARWKSKTRRVLPVSGTFNFSKLNNQAAEAATGEYLCLLNNDIEAKDAGWLGEMLNRCSEPDVGAVGALLVWPSGVVQHGGVVLGSNLGATHAFNDRLHTDCGYGDLLSVAHECSAVTAACLVTRREDYLALGGMDEVFFPINFNDVDYCLKLRAQGKRIVFTPYAKLLHLESASRGNVQSSHRRRMFERELRSLRARWLETLVADPYYSPLLSLDPAPFSALAVPRRDMSERWSVRPVSRKLPSGM